MKSITTFIFYLFIFWAFGQQQLKDIDTSFDYKERFYRKEKLITRNSWRYVRDNGQPSIGVNDLLLNPGFDTTGMVREKDGLWCEYFDKSWNPTDSSHQYYQILCEYNCGLTEGKVYYFRKNEIIYTGLRYPKLNDSIFNGSRRITYNNGKVEWIEYKLFREDSLRSKYYNTSSFFPNGELKHYTLSDDINFQYVGLKYNKFGICTYELKLNHNESYTIKRKRKGRKEIIDVRENGMFTKTVKVDGKVVRQRKHK
ncbi:hypothetical protein [Fluviicola sp.]|uniref:hypothetical protein n=1 Tax=Fluviicola sp. TaxID=1917219 RepID=UPI0031D9C660